MIKIYIYRTIIKLLKKGRYFLFCLLNKQILHHQIGRVTIPFLTKPYLKRSFAQQGEDLVLDRIITRNLKISYNNIETNNYIDIGGFHALENSVTYLLYLRGWSGLIFDASIETQKSFRKLRPRDDFVRKIVGKEDSTNSDTIYSAQNINRGCYTKILQKISGQKW